MSSELDEFEQSEDGDAQVDDDLRVAALAALPAGRRARPRYFAVALVIALACHGALAAAWFTFGPGWGPPDLAIRSGRGGAVGYGKIDDDAPLIYTPSKPDAVDVPRTDVPVSRTREVIEDNPTLAYAPRTEQTALSDVAGETTVIGLGRSSGAIEGSEIPQAPSTSKPGHSNVRAFGQINTSDTGGGGDGLAVTGEGLRSRFANDPPEYPVEARRRRMEGTVTLAILIDATGHVVDVKVVRSSGFPMLDKSAVEKVLTYRIPPYRENGVAMDVQLLQPFTFKLRG